MFLICISHRRAASPARPSGQCALTLSRVQHQEAGLASCSSRRVKCTASKGESCSLLVPLQPLPGPLLLRGKLFPEGERWGGGWTSALDGDILSYSLTIPGHCQMEGGGSGTGAQKGAK